jgi:hypothetical protein
MRRLPRWIGMGSVLFLATLACGKGNAASSRSNLAAASAHVDAANFKIDTDVAGCTIDNECTATIRLEALGGYHINDAYPYKFTAYDSPGVEFHGKDASNRSVFGKNNGDFEKQSEKVAVVRVRFKAPKGKVAFTGKFKMSVCSEASCQIDQPEVSFDGVVK